jgi:hypothetical protein
MDSEPEKPSGPSKPEPRAKGASKLEFFKHGIGAVTAVASLLGAVATLIAVSSGVFGGHGESGLDVGPTSGTTTGYSRTEDEGVLDLLPARFRELCEPSDAAHRGAGSLGSQTCAPAAVDGAQFDLYADSLSARRSFRIITHGYRRNRIACPGIGLKETYSVRGPATGLVKCFRSDRLAWVEWTEDGTPLEADAWDNMRVISRPYKWWAEYIRRMR